MLGKSLLRAAPVLIVALVACGCKGTVRQTSTSSKSPASAATVAPATAATETSCNGEACATGEAGRATGGPTTTVKVALKLPKGWKDTYAPRRDQGRARGCPATQMATMLGVQFASAHGCVIGRLEPGGAAERSGLKVGDSIKECNGGKVECLSTLDPLIWTTRNDRAELVVARGRSGSGPTKAEGTSESSKAK